MRPGLLPGACVLLAILVGGCGGNGGNESAQRVFAAIHRNCHEGGPRTVTPVDADGSGGVDYFIVTCVDGHTAYVKAP